MKKKLIPIFAVIGLLLILMGATLITKLVQKYTPTKEVMALTEQYNQTEANQVSIILNQELLDEKACLIDGKVYLDYAFVHDTINERFYWDENENILLYSTASDLITINADSTTYLVTKASNDFGSVIVKATSSSAWVNIDFVKQYSKMNYEYYDDLDCPRIRLNTEFGQLDTLTAKKDTALRALGGIKSPILTTVSKAETVYVLADYDDWKEVMTQSGIIGYVTSKTLGSASTETLACDYEEESFTHIVKDFEISMVWHQVTTQSANSNVGAVLSQSKGVNVISPTWFYLNDDNGNLADIASTTYVNYCHQQGVEVWGLVSNFENRNVDYRYVLSHTSTRTNLVNQIVSMAIQYNLDGINLDFESIAPSDEEEYRAYISNITTRDSYIQLVRELSYKCANNGIVLSVDNYVPTDYTAYLNRKEQAYFSDYHIIMGYDEHYSGSEAGSIASAKWVEQGVKDTLDAVPYNQVILAMPFYNRVWTLTPSANASQNDDGSYTAYDTSSYAVGMDEGASILKRNNATTEWLDDCGQTYGEYTYNNSIIKIWLEDSSALNSKLQIMDKYNLAGAAFWKAGLESTDAWDTIIKYIN